MFTGIVDAVGTVDSVEAGDGIRRLWIRVPDGYLDGVRPGASIAVDGACLTATTIDGPGFGLDVVGTTLERTIAGGYEEGDRVNLERAMALGERLDGHLVQGHVDGLGTVVAVKESGDFHYLAVRVPDAVHAQTIEHGSIAVNGVSLTVNRLLEEDSVEVAIIPHTWEHTNVRYLEVGDRVNVEGDLIGKYVARSLANIGRSREGGHAI